MKLPLRETFLMKIPYFNYLFSLRFEGFSEDFATYYNHIMETDPQKNLELFQNLVNSQEDILTRVIIHNLGVFYYRYQKNYWSKKRTSTFNYLIWEESFKNLLPTYNEKYDGNILIGPKWDKKSESYSTFFISEPDVHQYIIIGLELMFINETIPNELLPAFSLSILIVYYHYKKEVEDFIQTEDPTYKII